MNYTVDVPRIARKMHNDKKSLVEVATDTPMGKLLRQFWHPVALSRSVAPGKAISIRILGEDLTLYRGESGEPYVVGARCAHRGTLMHTGWVEGDHIRCIYHGWLYDASGQCVERPAETAAGNAGIGGYPALDYGGLIFAYFGPAPAPEFSLPRKEILEAAERVTFARKEQWPCNWFQMIENSMDATHVSFAHQAGIVGAFGKAITTTVPALKYTETEAGVEQRAVRADDNVRVSDWTFPNNNHIIIPGFTPRDPWVDICVWMVPVDRENTIRFFIYSAPMQGADAERFTQYFERYGEYNPANHHEELFDKGVYPIEQLIQLTGAQDYVATVGQGTIADTENERLGKSDAGVVFLRRLFWRELDALESGEPTKPWRKLTKPAELPHPPVPA
ncbi:MAG TPA: Rieske 2Fe-2S domain-containing protein [Burkholderiaceae bacterium]|nr:Rieske 2Fe-2S domain-containing protein [Burkholderiaceae bacterium]